MDFCWSQGRCPDFPTSFHPWGSLPAQNIPRFPAQNEAATDWDRSFQRHFQRLSPKENTTGKSRRDLHPTLRGWEHWESWKTGKAGKLGREIPAASGWENPREFEDWEECSARRCSNPRKFPEQILGWDFPALNKRGQVFGSFQRCHSSPFPAPWPWSGYSGNTLVAAAPFEAPGGKNSILFPVPRANRRKKPQGKWENSNAFGREFLWKTSGEHNQRLPQLVFPWKTSLVSARADNSVGFDPAIDPRFPKGSLNSSQRDQ